MRLILRPVSARFFTPTVIMEVAVLVKSISKERFSELLPPHLVLERLMVHQVEWFVRRRESLLGTIAEGQGEAAWNYAILSRNDAGNFRVSDVRANFHSHKAARVDLVLAMFGTRPRRRNVPPIETGE